MIYPCITLHLPWAYWVMMGWKTIETRTHRKFAILLGSNLAIHASRTWDYDAMTLHAAGAYLTAEQRSMTTRINPDAYYGRILCTAKCYAFRELNDLDAPLALIECAHTRRFGTFLTGIKPLQPFIKARGYRGIWNYEIDDVAA